MPAPTQFLLVTEISCIFSQGGKVRRVHVLVMVPDLDIARKVNAELAKRGAKLASDGRPVIGMSVHDLAVLVLSISDQSMIIPAHAWTPWFGVLGSKGGFDSLAEAFGDVADQIMAIETGLSSDPAMNWRVSELDTRAILSFSDAHSPGKLGRELTVLQGNREFTYSDVWAAFAEASLGHNHGHLKIQETWEFYPEEGKYHWDGHRVCDVVQSPSVTRKNGTTCPVCGKALTIGVEYRVEELADRPLEIKTQANNLHVICKQDARQPQRPPYVSIVPLPELIAAALKLKVTSKKVTEQYLQLTRDVASEFELLLYCSPAELETKVGLVLTTVILKMRRGELTIKPGYDGVFGLVEISDNSVQSELFL